MYIVMDLLHNKKKRRKKCSVLYTPHEISINKIKIHNSVYIFYHPSDVLIYVATPVPTELYTNKVILDAKMAIYIQICF